MRKRDGKTLQKNERRRIEEKDSFGEAKEHTENIETKKDRFEAEYGMEEHRWKMYTTKRKRERDIYI